MSPDKAVELHLMQLESTLRLALADDAECLAAFSVHVWLATYATDGVSGDMAKYVLAQFAPEAFRLHVSDRDVQVVVAEVAEGLAGFALLRYGVQCPNRTEVTCELEHLYVLPGLQAPALVQSSWPFRVTLCEIAHEALLTGSVSMLTMNERWTSIESTGTSVSARSISS